MTTDCFSKRTLRTGLVLSSVFAVGLLAARLGAYTINGPKWGTANVTYYVNPQNKYVAAGDALSAIRNAAAAWSGAANVALVYGGTTTDATLALDGVNEVFFRDDAPGAIATTYWWYDGSNRLLDADIVLHENYRFYAGNAGCNGDGFFIENTGAHEFGHVLGLGHSAVDVATMWPYSGACEIIRETLDADDTAGLRAIYPGAAPAATLPPAAPSSLTVGASAADPSGSMVLTWTDNASDEAGYRIERSRDGSAFSAIAQLGINATSYVDSGLAAASTYWYRVAAYNSAGTSAYSNVGSAQTAAAPAPTTAPGAPSNPSPADGSRNVNTAVTLIWSAANAQRFDVYLDNTLRASDITASSLKLTVTAGATHSWKVVAKNGAGSTPGPLWSFTTKRSRK